MNELQKVVKTHMIYQASATLKQHYRYSDIPFSTFLGDRWRNYSKKKV